MNSAQGPISGSTRRSRSKRLAASECPCQTADMSKRAQNSDRTSLELAGRHRLLVVRVDGGHSVQIITPEGTTPITIRVTSQGVDLKIHGPGIALNASGALSLSAEKLILEGREGVTIASGGDLELAVAGEMKSHARAHMVRATGGSVSVKASDDVKLSGERVMVNCDETVDRHYRQPAVLNRPANAQAALPSAPPTTRASKGS